ncbi:hypothetical protein ACFWNN_31235 [Lentzea sp. NPDC058450]|uniref:hypothetical protein n=1 Tax=Lentzea sp. NPDC058450 TaxID=3346505 RepID=UPI0036595B6D
MSRPETDELRYPVWPLTIGGLVAIAAGVALSVTLTQGFVFLCLLGGLAYALGVSGLSQRKWVALPAFALGLVAPFVLTFGVHSVLLQHTAQVESCTVTSKDEHPFVKYPRVDYVLACPSGEIELERDWSDRLKTGEAEVLVGPPLRPDWADEGRWNLLPVTSVPGAMILLVPVARLLRKQP